jgi:uncharacterized protein (TIGR02145 family)
MKKTSVFLLGVLLSAITIAQAPHKMSFQTVVRNIQGKLVLNQSIGVRASILKTSSTGSAVYVETHTKSTNVNGLLTLEVGAGSVSSGTFAAINWSEGPYFLKTEMDVNGGANYTITGVTEFVSVPYALNSKTSDATKTLSNGSNVGDMNYWNGTTWVPLKKGVHGQTLTFCEDKPTWTIGGVCPGKIQSLNCLTVSNVGTLIENELSANTTSSISYTGGDGGPYEAQTVLSSGVQGLSAIITAGTFANGAGTLTYNIIGTPKSNGYARFNLNIGGVSCSFERLVKLKGTVTSLDCSPTSKFYTSGTLYKGIEAAGVTSGVTYSSSNGGSYFSQSISSTGVTGLKANLVAGTLSTSTLGGYVTYTITGIPNSVGTASFEINLGGKTCILTRTVNPSSGSGTNITDVDGNSYKTIYIGTQQWMGENLKTTKFSDGTAIPNIANSTWNQITNGAWCYYNNDPANNTKYGKLYNWFAVNKTTNGGKNICPTGWHVPSDGEWTILSDYLGGESVAGGKLKEVGTINWLSPNKDASNTTLFTALPGGCREILLGDNFKYFGILGSWWSTTEVNLAAAYYRQLSKDDGIISRGYINVKGDGRSVRCIKD